MAHGVYKSHLIGVVKTVVHEPCNNGRLPNYKTDITNITFS